MRVFLLAIFIVSFLLGLFLLPPHNETPLRASKPQAEFYEKAIKYNVQEPRGAAAGAIVNHHLLAPHLIAQTLLRAAASDPKIVVLISPSHFDRGFSHAISAAESWQTPFGNLPAARYQIAKLARSKIISLEPKVLADEHGLGNIVGFIKKIFPNAKILPLAIKESLTENESLALAKSLNAYLPERTLFLGSFDFSHYQSPEVTRANDAISLDILNNFNIEQINQVSIDSKAGLKLLMQIMQLRGATKFNLVINTNSAELTGVATSDTTSYINGFFTGEEI